MKSFLLKVAAQFIVQIMLLISILLLLRGHNYPGGGFVAALFAAASIRLLMIASSEYIAATQSISHSLLVLGTICLVISVAAALWDQLPLLTAYWGTIKFMGNSVKLGTPLLFDVGLYFLITGGLASMLISVSEPEEWPEC